MIQKRFLNSKSVAAKDIFVGLGGARRGWRMLHDGPLIVEESKIQGTRDGLRSSRPWSGREGPELR
jgi:hypothetical protein